MSQALPKPALLVFAALLLLPVAGVTQKPAPPPAPAPEPAQGAVSSASGIRPPAERHFSSGETYVYEVEWRLWKAGTATLRIEDAGSEQRVLATADSTGVATLLYTVRDRFEAFFDRKSFCSRHLTKHTEEGFRKLQTGIRFDYARRKSLLEETDLRSGKSKKVENDIPECVTDVVSGIYYLGSQPLAPDATYSFPLNDGGRTTQVEAHVEAREEVRAPAGTFQTVRVQPRATTGVLKDRGQVWIWYSDDVARIPVQMRARMFWGTLTFRLVRIDRR
ncbi:MAG: DUF3108 domain-containing protein [Terriglobales bacterium]